MGENECAAFWSERGGDWHDLYISSSGRGTERERERVRKKGHV